MTEGSGGELRDWRRSRGWDVPELARQLRRAADEPIAAHDGLVRMIRGWERGDHRLSERYELLYRKLGLPDRDNDEPNARSAHIGGQEGSDPVRRRTFVELTGVSMASAILPASAGTRSPVDIEPLALVLTAQMTGASPDSSQEPPDIAALAGNVSRARKHYQACRYSELISHLPRLLGQLDAACCFVDGDDKLHAFTLSADAYHVAAGLLLKLGDHGLAHLATDRSMTAALASQDPLTVGASARIVTHTLMSSGHLPAAIATARNHAVRLDHQTGTQTPESLSVYGSVLLRGAIAAALHDERGTAHELLAEAVDAARRVGTDANLRGTAFGPVNAQLHQVNVAVTLGDAGTAIDLARQINLTAITVTERKASLLIDVARAFFQWGRYERAHAVLRAAEQTAPQEVTARASVRTLARDLAAVAPRSIRRDAEQFASRIGASR
ncbi:MAG TPA: XRE family transcriptional regulator [Streptosporangiaceae bacterium]